MAENSKIITDAYEHLIERFTRWAAAQDDIRAALIIGSRARVDDRPADEWSDLDIGMIVTQPDRYLASADWVENIGRPWLTFIEPTADGRGLERRVLFAGGLDVDFAVLPAAMIEQLAAHGVPPDVADALRRGMRLLLDKDGAFGRLSLPPAEQPAPQPPTEHEFLEVVNDFWYHAVWTAKHLRRGELWWAKSGCDGALKRLLLKMMEWHARATQGQQHDTWLRGRFLEEWVDPRVLPQLQRAFAHYDEADIWQALFATMDLFRWLAVETAEQLRYSYPTFGAERATELARQLFDER
jgi:aminoglycoside 6-adenylyltransferase